MKIENAGEKLKKKRETQEDGSENILGSACSVESERDFRLYQDSTVPCISCGMRTHTQNKKWKWMKLPCGNIGIRMYRFLSVAPTPDFISFCVPSSLFSSLSLLSSSSIGKTSLHFLSIFAHAGGRGRYILFTNPRVRPTLSTLFNAFLFGIKNKKFIFFSFYPPQKRLFFPLIGHVSIKGTSRPISSV